MSDSDSAPSTHELIRLARLDFAGILITTLGYGGLLRHIVLHGYAHHGRVLF